MVTQASRLAAAHLPNTLLKKPPASLIVWMLVAIGVVTGLAWWDEQREADAALRDLESEQSVVAWSAAGTLRAHLTSVERDAILVGEHGTGEVGDRYAPVIVRRADAPGPSAADPTRILLTVPIADGRIVDFGVRPSDLVDRDQRLARPGELMILVAPPNETSLRSVDGRVVSSPALRGALDRGAPTVRLARPEAAEIGLPARTSMAGFARVDGGNLGRWGVVAVASAARERDREKRAIWRLVLGVLVASGLVLAFGGAALRRQRAQLEVERELAVAEVRHARDEELLEAERVATMGTFALGIAHELGTPLGVIVGRAEQLVAKVQGDERAVRSAQAILAQADRIGHIVRRFLDMARGGPPSLALVNPSSVGRAAVGAVEHRFARTNVALTTDIPASMPRIQCDADLLEQALVNLLLNACEACVEGGHVEIAARTDGAQVAFVVTDDGAGISAENARRATEPFFTTKPAGKGTGLGLAIATEIVKSHRGTLTIAPREELGTRAVIEIPVAR
jgi:two-component system NtrC family sensor kinase